MAMGAMVRQAGVDHGLGFVDATTDRGGDAVDDSQQMVVVAKAHGRQLQLAAPLHIDLKGSIDQNVGHAVVLQQRLKRAQAHHLVEHRGAQLLDLGGVERQAFGAGEFADQDAHLAAQLPVLQLFQLGQIHFLDQPAMQSQLGVEQGVGGGDRLGFGRRRGGERDGVAGRLRGRGLDGGALETEPAHPTILSALSPSTAFWPVSWATRARTSRTILERGWR